MIINKDEGELRGGEVVVRYRQALRAVPRQGRLGTAKDIRRLTIFIAGDSLDEL